MCTTGNLSLTLCGLKFRKTTQDVGGKSYHNGDTPFQTYLLFNGLDVDSDPVLGTYSVTVERGFSGDPFKVTALVNGDVVWVEEGTLNSGGDSPTAFEVELTTYAESDCSIDVYGEYKATAAAVSLLSDLPSTEAVRGELRCQAAVDTFSLRTSFIPLDAKNICGAKRT